MLEGVSGVSERTVADSPATLGAGPDDRCTSQLRVVHCREHGTFHVRFHSHLVGFVVDFEVTDPFGDRMLLVEDFDPECGLLGVLDEATPDQGGDVISRLVHERGDVRGTVDAHVAPARADELDDVRGMFGWRIGQVIDEDVVFLESIGSEHCSVCRDLCLDPGILENGFEQLSFLVKAVKVELVLSNHQDCRVAHARRIERGGNMLSVPGCTTERPAVDRNGLVAVHRWWVHDECYGCNELYNGRTVGHTRWLIVPFYGGEELQRVYDEALADSWGLIASNIVEPNVLIGLMEGAASVDSDLLLQASAGACKFAGNGDLDAGLWVLGNYIETIAEQFDIGVFLNMDHHQSLPAIESQVRGGIPSSIMIDASHHSFEENVRRSRAAVELAAKSEKRILVEAELGRIKGAEDEIASEEAYYTDPERAVDFVEATGCDLLAVSIGTQHGVAKGEDLDLRPSLAREINETLHAHGLSVPLVLHGSTGVQPGQLRTLLDHGICKVNKDTRYQYEFARTLYDLYREQPEAIVPPAGVDDDRETFFNSVQWSPNKDVFDPRVGGRAIRERIATVHASLAEVAGSAGRSMFP